MPGQFGGRYLLAEKRCKLSAWWILLATYIPADSL